MSRKQEAPPAEENAWIWDNRPALRNAYVRFRRAFKAAKSDSLILRVSADTRYWIWVNGELLGTGPVRSWPNHWKYDEYEIAAHLRPGRNVIAVLVNHLGKGSFQYLATEPGLWCQLLRRRKNSASSELLLAANRHWRTSPSESHLSQTPHTSIQLGFEEQFDSRAEDSWTSPDYDDTTWARATPVPPPHPTPEPSGIPHLTSDPVLPVRIIRGERVRPADYTWTLDLKPSLLPGDLTTNIAFVKAFLVTQIFSPQRQEAIFLRPHYHSSAIYLNHREIPAILAGLTTPIQPQKVTLEKGWNTLLVPYPSLEASDDGIKPPFAIHLLQFVLCVSAKHPLEWACRGEQGGSPWAVVGPFKFNRKESAAIKAHCDYPRVSLPDKARRRASAPAFARTLRDGFLHPRLLEPDFFTELTPDCICTRDAAASAFADTKIAARKLINPAALLRADSTSCTIKPPGDIRILVDFGQELVGRHCFEIEAPAGTIVDIHNFEFIQKDGLENYADGMNNSLRYICREGRQTFRSLQRRGFQYSWIIIRGARSEVRLTKFHVEFATYPQARRGSFTCSDDLLNRIWEIGAHTLRCCSEDTYTDCPSYEQTHWVGDARNEALVDWVVNGDHRLWFRCLEQTAQSLERSPLTLSHVPSSWSNLLPAWSFLWMRSCREYLLWTGDYEGARQLLPWVIRNIAGLRRHINDDDLFEIRGWNMFDWAAMDTPHQGVITHLNCFAVLALRDCAELATWLGKKTLAQRWLALADRLATAINSRLWNARERAYTDCLRDGSSQSRVFSQQTQAAALVAGIPAGSRLDRCRKLVLDPPAHFVKAASPFFEFFLLEILDQEGDTNGFLDTIRKDWGFMLDCGATTFWEMWSLKHGRLTRSHCHGWSAAPTYFLATSVLGIQPLAPGLKALRVRPRLGDLKYVSGSVPTPEGVVHIECRKESGMTVIKTRAPRSIDLFLEYSESCLQSVDRY